MARLITATFALVAVAVTLAGCGDQPPAELTTSSSATPLVGTMLVHGMGGKGQAGTMALAILPDGRTYGYETHGNTLVGRIDPQATTIDSEFRAYNYTAADLSFPAHFQMTQVAPNKYQGTMGAVGERVAEFTAEPYAAEPAASSQIAGSWTARHSGAHHVIGVDGNIVGSGSDNGCTLKGTILPVKDKPLFDLNLTLSYCKAPEQDGSYQGGAFIWTNGANEKLLVGVVANDSYATPFALELK